MPKFNLKVPVDITIPGYYVETVEADTLEEAQAIIAHKADKAAPGAVETDHDDLTPGYVSVTGDPCEITQQLRFTFAVGAIGPSSDGDSATYWLVSVTAPALRGPEDLDADDIEAAREQLITELAIVNGQRLGEQLAFIVFISAEEEDANDE